MDTSEETPPDGVETKWVPGQKGTLLLHINSSSARLVPCFTDLHISRLYKVKIDTSEETPPGGVEAKWVPGHKGTLLLHISSSYITL
jgi:hypothetical protein